jgi:hypothetical protein
VIIFVPAPAPAPVFIPAPAPVFIPAPAPVVIPAPAPVVIPAPVVETVSVIVVAPPVLTAPAPAPAPAELTTQKQVKVIDAPIVEVVPDKVLTKITVPKLAAFKGTGPFKFALALSEQASATPIVEQSLASGLKVISQTPNVCRVASTFNKGTGKYSITVIGISNGQCRITALDKGNDEKFPSATEIKQTITGIVSKKTVSAKNIKPTPAPKPGVKKASFTPPKG